MNVETKLQVLDYKDLFQYFKKDKGGRWCADEGTVFEEYIDKNGYRTPSRAWPHSHTKPCLTRKFIKWVMKEHPDFYNVDLKKEGWDLA